MTRLDPSRSPCKRHPCSVEHADRVRGYRELARLWDEEAERETRGYAAEMALRQESDPRPTFREYLVMTRCVDKTHSDQ